MQAWLDDSAAPPSLKSRLELSQRIRDFAVARLHLPDNPSYRRYADLKRRYVVWNVFAAPELSLKAQTSCYPLLGCLDYRGFFSEARARLHAATLQAQGYDTFVGGVAAYSTLGWLDDPVLNTVLRRDEAHLVDIIFHELAHQRLYIAGDTTFNESFAMAVARAGGFRDAARLGGVSASSLSGAVLLWPRVTGAAVDAEDLEATLDLARREVELLGAGLEAEDLVRAHGSGSGRGANGGGDVSPARRRCMRLAQVKTSYGPAWSSSSTWS